MGSAGGASGAPSRPLSAPPAPQIFQPGLVHQLHHLLWTRTASGSTCNRISLPDTVIIENGEPMVWYFSSKVQKQILRKRAENLTEQQIVRKWASRCAREGAPVTSVLLWPDTDIDGIEPELYLKPIPHPQVMGIPPKGKEIPVTSVRYMDATSLDAFLTRDFKPTSAVLQRFITPLGPHNAMIRAVWHPHIMEAEMRENHEPMVPESFPGEGTPPASGTESGLDPIAQRDALEARLVTFEGSMFLSKKTDLRTESPALYTRVAEACDAIASHVSEIFTGAWSVKHMVLYFKEDFEGRLWLLFCTGFSLEGPGKGVEAPDRPLSVRTSKLSTQIKNEVKPLTTHGAFLCCHCGRVKEYDSKTSIDFYTLISEYESKVGMEPDDRRRAWLMEQMPPGIARSLKSLSRKQYLTERSNVGFHRRRAEVCSQCFEGLIAFRKLWVKREDDERRLKLEEKRRSQRTSRRTSDAHGGLSRPITARTTAGMRMGGSPTPGGERGGAGWGWDAASGAATPVRGRASVDRDGRGGGGGGGVSVDREMRGGGGGVSVDREMRGAGGGGVSIDRESRGGGVVRVLDTLMSDVGEMGASSVARSGDAGASGRPATVGAGAEWGRRGGGGAVGSWRHAVVEKESRSQSARVRRARLKEEPYVITDTLPEIAATGPGSPPKLSRQTIRDMADRLSRPKKVHQVEEEAEPQDRALPAPATLVRVMRVYMADPLMRGRATSARPQQPRRVDVQQGLRELLSNDELEMLQRVLEGPD